MHCAAGHIVDGVGGVNLICNLICVSRERSRSPQTHLEGQGSSLVKELFRLAPVTYF